MMEAGRAWQVILWTENCNHAGAGRVKMNWDHWNWMTTVIHFFYNMENFLSVCLFFFLMNTDQLFRRLSLNLVCQMFPRDKTSVIHFWHQLYKSDALFALQHMTSGCLTVCDAHVESLVKIVSAKILHHRVATFPFIMDKDLVETCKSNFHPLVLTSVIDSCLHQLLPWWLSMGELWH